MSNMNNTNNLSEVQTVVEHTMRTEDFPTIVESVPVHARVRNPNKKKMDCNALPKDGTEGNQVQKLSKNTAKKRKRAEQLEPTTSAQNIVSLIENQPQIPITNHTRLEPSRTVNVTDASQKNGGVTKIKQSSKQNTIKENTIAFDCQVRKSIVIPCKTGNTNVKSETMLPKIQTERNGNCVLNEIDENLFNLPRDVALAHCISEDLRMERGVGVQFKRYFGGIGQLIDQKLTIGSVGVIVKDVKENAFYMVTKKHFNGQTTMQSLSSTLKLLLQKMKQMKLTKLGIPQIGCGIDGLDWSEVKPLIANIFAGSGIHITVCVPTKIFYRPPPPQLKVFITPKNVLGIADKISDILVFIDVEECKKNNWKSSFVEELNSRYPSLKEKLMKDIKNKELNPGDVTQYLINKERINCLFTSQAEYYSSLEKCFINIKNHIRSYRNFAIPSGPVKPVEQFKNISRIVLILRSIVYSSELWLCGDTDQTQDKEIYENYCRTVFEDKRLSTKQTDIKNHKNSEFNRRKGKINSPPTKNLQRK